MASLLAVAAHGHGGMAATGRCWCWPGGRPTLTASPITDGPPPQAGRGRVAPDPDRATRPEARSAPGCRGGPGRATGRTGRPGFCWQIKQAGRGERLHSVQGRQRAGGIARATACKQSTCLRSPTATDRWSPRVQRAVTPAGLGRSCQGGATEVPSPEPRAALRRGGHRHLLAMPRALAQAMGMVGPPGGAPNLRWAGGPAGGPSGRPPAPRAPSHTVVGSKNV
jgi:hypothetical protein